MKLVDKVAIITGSSRGIGRSTAILFAKEGAHVVVNYKTHKKEAQSVVRSIGNNSSLLVQADMTKGAGKELIEQFRLQTPLKRIAEPEELARAILFLASDDASYITGHILVVDGGYSLK